MKEDSNYQTIDEDIRKQFESAWAAGNPQPIESVAGDPTSEKYLATLEELVYIELEYLWKSRDPLKRPLLEDYLQRFECLLEPDILSRLVTQEIAVRISVGETPSTVEYQERFPGVRVEIPGTDQAEQDTGILNEDNIETHREMPTLAPGALQEDPDLASVTMVDQDPPHKKAIIKGDFVPGYDLLGELGRGGMGVVYRARDQKLKRVVALKMILSGAHASEEDMQRFQVEAEAVAKLQHANIVQIYEVGEHRGNPYISLEYQEGGGLDEKIAGTPQNVEESAQLIETLARAMQVAHAQGIIHRDLKPANILLAADGEPKITDFGLAKRMDEDSNQTKSGAVMGTPSYMAPEQAASSKESLGPAADTYALGAILYHLLTGRPPFRGETQLDTLMQVISDEPVAPRRFNSKVPTDLETICLKCLQKEIGRRYRSAEELAEDLRRFVAGEPISARPVTEWERTWKWARRRPAIAGLIVLSLVSTIAIVVAGISYNRLLKGSLQQAESLREEEQQQRKLAEEGRQRAEENLFMAAQLVEKYLTELSQNELMNVPKMEGLRRELLEEALVYYERFVEQDSDDVLLTKKLADAHYRLGTVLRDLGENAKSIEHFKKAVAISEQIKAEYPYDAGVSNRVAVNESALGSAYHRTGDLKKAESLFMSALDHCTTRLNLGVIYNKLGSLRNEQGDYRLAAKWLSEAIRIYGEELKTPSSYPNPNEQEVINGLAEANNAYGWSLRQQTKLDLTGEELQRKRAEAQAAYEKAISGYRELLQRTPESMQATHGLAKACINLGSLQFDLEKRKEAEKVVREANGIMEQLVADHPGIRPFTFTLGDSYRILAVLAVDDLKELEGKELPQETRGLFEKSLQIQELLVKEQADVPSYEASLAKTYEVFATALLVVGEEEEAGEYLTKATTKYLKNIDLGERLAREQADDVENGLFLLNSYKELGELWHKHGNVEQEINVYRRAIVFFEPVVAPIRIKYAKQLGSFKYKEATADYAKIRFLLELAQFHEKLGDLFTGTENYFAATFHYRGAAGIHIQWTHTLKYKFKEHQVMVKAREVMQPYAGTLKFVDEYVQIKGASDLVFFAAAGMYALASELAAKDQTINGVERGVRTEQYARRAIELLEEADEHRFFKLTSRLDDLRKDELFDSIRERDDYKELVDRLEETLK